MNKNTKSPKSNGPGRPKAVIKVPNRKFTFADLEAVNTHVTPLTLRKFLKADMFTDKGNPRNTSTIVRLKNESREPDSEKGLGRKTYVYIKRDKLSTLKSASKSTATVNVGTAAEKSTVEPVELPTAPVAADVAPEVAPAPLSEYEQTKAALLA